MPGGICSTNEHSGNEVFCCFAEQNSRKLHSQTNETIERYAIDRPLAPELRSALAERGLAFASLDEFEQALDAARRDVGYSPTAERNQRYGLLLAAQGQHEEALSFFTRAIELQNDNAAAYAERGLAYGLLERYDQAMLDLATAIRIDPACQRAWINRAALHVQRGIWGDAITDAGRAIRLAPEYAPAYRLRAMGHKVAGARARALADFRRFLELDPAAPDRAQIERAIAILEQPEAASSARSWLARLFGRGAGRQ